MKKLTYIANLRLPTDKAHSIQIMKMCEAFAMQGVALELVVPDKKDNIGESKVMEYYGIKTPFKIRRVWSLDLLGRTRRFGRVLYWIDLAVFLFCLAALPKSERGTHFYSRDPFLLLPFMFGGNRLFVELHSLPKKSLTFYKLIRQVNGVVALTRRLKTVLVEKGLNEEKIIVAPDAVDLEAFDLRVTQSEARAELSLPADKILIGYAGMLRTMGMEKGVESALRSLVSLSEEKMLLVVGGHKSEVEFYAGMAKDLGVSARVIFVGRVAPNKVPLYLKACDVLVAPFPDTEHYRHYMSPLKLFEYMASGVPIVVSDLPSIREIVDDSMVKFMDPHDSGSLASLVMAILDNQEEASNLSERASAAVRDYAWPKRAGAIMEFIK